MYMSISPKRFSLGFLPGILSKNNRKKTPLTLASSKVGYFSASSLALLFSKNPGDWVLGQNGISLGAIDITQNSLGDGSKFVQFSPKLFLV